jgi:L-seryl-tRNA(Ser) seleniumtransferase
MGKEALEAMNEAARETVRLDELQAAASKVIAQRTHAEAGIVTAGASAALTLGTAACIAGLDEAKMDRLPDTTDMFNEVIMPWHQMTRYDHAYQSAGAKLTGVGIVGDNSHPDEGYVMNKRLIEEAITEKTVAIAYTYTARHPPIHSHPPLEEVIEIGKRYNIPVIVDAAAQVPPLENLHHFIDIGADLVCFSGGKGIRGPQASGILCGRRDLTASAAIQMLLINGRSFEEWKPPSLTSKEKLGRGMKVTKEAIVGLLVALQDLTEEKFAKEAEHLRQLLEGIATRLGDIAGIHTRITEDYRGGTPTLEVEIDGQIVGRSAVEVSQRLEDGEPRIYERGKVLHKELVIIHSINLDEETARIVGEHLYTAITG